MKNIKKLALATAIASSTIGGSGMAFGAVGLEEIIVTARKREESIQDIPVAVTAVTGEVFERSLVANFEEATALMPGFSTNPQSTSPHALALSIRGSVQDASIITADPSVGVYVDGVYIARAFGIGVDLLDIRDIQVLKGPQGTLFGRNSTAGAMLLNTNDPILEEFSGSVSLTAGDELTGGDIVLNVPLGDKFALRVAHQQRDRDDYVKNVANDPNNPVYNALADTITRIPYTYSPAKTYDSQMGGYENETTRVKLRFMPTDSLDMVLSYEEYESDLAGPPRDQVWVGGFETPQDEGDDTISLSFDPRAYAETETTNFNLTHESDIGEIKFIYGHREYRSLNEVDYDGGDYAAAPVDFVVVVSARRHGSWGRTFGDQDSYELQWVTSFFDDKVDFTIGTTYFEEDSEYFDYSDGLDINRPGTPVGPAGYVTQQVEALGYYAQGTWHIDDVSNLTLGIRSSEEDKDAKIWPARRGVLPSWDFAGMYEGVDPQTDASASFSSTDWLISYDRQLTDEVMAYAKVSTGFRSGGFNGRPVGAGLPVNFGPEELTEYELGLKGDFLDGKFRWNTAIYSNETDGKQFSVLAIPTGEGATVPASLTKNAGTAETQGFETEFTYLLNENWSLSGSYAYIDTEYTELISFNPETDRDEPVPSERLPLPVYVPENEWTLSLNYDQEFDSMIVRGTATYHWIDEKFHTNESAAEILYTNPGVFTEAQAQAWVDSATSDSFGILNMNISISTLDEKYTASLWSKNVLDERAHQSSIAFILAPFYAYSTATYTQPRTVGITLKANF